MKKENMKTLIKNFAVASLSLGTAYLGLTVGAAQAISLADLIGGQSLTVLDKTFENWMLIDNPDSVDLSQIDVTPLADDPLNPGIEYTTNLSLTGSSNIPPAETLDLLFSFDVATVSGEPLIRDNSLTITDCCFSGAGAVAILETVSDAAGGLLGNKLVFDDPGQGIQQLTASLEFSPQAQLTITNTIQLIADEPGETSTLNKFEQRFSQVQVPEPNAVLGLGLLSLGAFCQRQLNKKNKQQENGEDT